MQFYCMKKVHIIKIGGNVLDNSLLLASFLKDFAALEGPKILVHGGGKLATHLADTLGIPQTLMDGRRITDAETLRVTIMVYAGLINKSLTAKLQALQCNSMGVSGADCNLIRSKKREHPSIDFGLVGDVTAEGVNILALTQFLQEGLVPVICPITHDRQGNLLNTNADTLATVIAISLHPQYHVQLSFCFEKKGVLINASDDQSWIPRLNKDLYQTLRSRGMITKGMIPKLDNAFNAFEAGIPQVCICHPEAIGSLTTQPIGTELVA